MRARVYSAPVQRPADPVIVHSAAVPAPGGPLRVAFIGQPARLAGSVDDQPSSPETVNARLTELRPDVVVALGPGCPPGALAGTSAITVGYLDEPAAFVPGSFDRVIAADDGLAAEAEEAGTEVWRVLPLPVADHHYRPARRPTGPARVIDLDGSESPVELDRADVAVRRGPEGGPAGRHAVLRCMAAGVLVVSAPLPSMPWLEPDIDFVAADRDERFAEALETLRREPAAFHRQRLGGRLKAEWMRASSVWARVVGDLRRDLSAFGSNR